LEETLCGAAVRDEAIPSGIEIDHGPLEADEVGVCRAAPEATKRRAEASLDGGVLASQGGDVVV
jgi:hypothetical protein